MQIIIPDNSNDCCVLLFSKRDSTPYTIHCYHIVQGEPEPPVEAPAPVTANPSNGNGARAAASPAHSKPGDLPPLGKLKAFMMARGISDASMLDYLKEEGRIADFVTRLCEVPDPVLEDLVSSWVEMDEEVESEGEK